MGSTAALRIPGQHVSGPVPLLAAQTRIRVRTDPPAPCVGLRYLSMAESLEATDVSNPALNYGVVLDCGSSGSRVFVYYWPPHNGNPHTLLDIRQMKDRDRTPVVKKIKPGESVLGQVKGQRVEAAGGVLTEERGVPVGGDRLHHLFVQGV